MFFFCIKLENGKRYSVDTDMDGCTKSIPINLSRLKIRKNVFYLLKGFIVNSVNRNVYSSSIPARTSLPIKKTLFIAKHFS